MEVLPPVDDEPLFDELLPELFELFEPLDGLEELLPLLLLELLDELLLELFLLLEEVFPDVARHRIVLNTRSRAAHVTELQVIAQILKEVPQPTAQK